MQQLENDLDQVQESLLKANIQLVEKDKALSNVSEAGPVAGAGAPRLHPELAPSRIPEATNVARSRA